MHDDNSKYVLSCEESFLNIRGFKDNTKNEQQKGSVSNARKNLR
jgi:hypothetical protein